MPSMPRRMIATWISQKTPNAIALWPPHVGPAGGQRRHQRVERERADPRLDAEPAARDERARHRGDVRAADRRSSSGTSTGNGMPYFVPGCALSSIGISTITLPSETVSSACHHVMPGRDQPGRERVGRDDDRQPDPQRREVVGAPRAPLDAPSARGPCWTACDSGMVLMLHASIAGRPRLTSGLRLNAVGICRSRSDPARCGAGRP